jgi:hypothetical protein
VAREGNDWVKGRRKRYKMVRRRGTKELLAQIRREWLLGIVLK